MDRAVARGRARKTAIPIRYLGVDEKAFRKGHRYHTLVCDLERTTVEYVAEDRTVERVAPFFASVDPAQRDATDAVAMDMWDPYIRDTRKGLADDAARRSLSHHAKDDQTKIVSIKRKASGFRNPDPFKTAIYFHCRGLGLYSRLSRNDPNNKSRTAS